MKVSKIISISLERKRIYKINEIEHVAGYGNGGVRDLLQIQHWW